MFLDPIDRGSIEGWEVVLKNPLDRSQIELRKPQQVESRSRANRVLLSGSSQSAPRLLDSLINVSPCRQCTEVI